MPTLLEVKNLVVERGDVPVLKIPEFSLREGERLALIGPNGAGKTTFLLTLARLLKAQQGELLFRGQDVSSSSQTLPYRRRLAMVFQEPLLLDTTVYNNVAAGLKIRRMKRDEIRQRVVKYAALVHISHLLDRSARNLSGGEAQRTNLARALATEPEIMFLDEPFVNLDAPSREALIEDLRHILRNVGVTSIISTHDRLEALRLADHLAVMDQGSIVQMGICQEVMNHPVNEIVASFVGMETIFSGQVEKVTDGGFVLSVQGCNVEVAGGANLGESVLCCIRPENIIISARDAGKETSVRNNLPARIVKIVPQGPFFKVFLDAGFLLIGYITQQSLESLALEKGKPVIASFKATAIHVIRREEMIVTQEARLG